jgi:aquaporin Z
MPFVFACHQMAGPESHGHMSTAFQVDGQAQEKNRAGRTPAVAALRAHWREYLIEAAGLGTFMISACFFTVILEHPASIVRQIVHTAFYRHVLTGIAMGLTAIALIYSPWGRQSGAHFNPSTTLTFLRLGKMEPWDAMFYVVAQFIGGTAGVLLAAGVLSPRLMHDQVRYAMTRPGPRGSGVAFVAEIGISFVMMTMVLNVSNSARVARFTGVCAGALVATYISLESPLSGMSMNPARSFASAFPAGMFDALWIYFTAPPIGMLLASEVYVRMKGARRIYCAKLHHDNEPCIFRCNYPALANQKLNLKEVV